MSLNYVERIDNEVKIKRVIISVSDKRGLDKLVPALIKINPEMTIYSTGGTFKALREILAQDSPKSLIQLSEYTGQPEMQGGLVKSLDFKIYLGLLSEPYNRAHDKDLKRLNAVAFDMVVVNLYPFVKTIEAPGVRLESARANIDIGGPCMIRAAAKNFLRVVPVIDPDDYTSIIKELEQSGGCISLKTRFELAGKAFAHTAAYDRAIAGYLAEVSFEEWRGK